MSLEPDTIRRALLFDCASSKSKRSSTARASGMAEEHHESTTATSCNIVVVVLLYSIGTPGTVAKVSYSDGRAGAHTPRFVVSGFRAKKGVVARHATEMQ